MNKELSKFFIINFSIIVFLCLCLALWFSWLEWNYQILNFIQFRTPVPITAEQVLRQYITAMDRDDIEIAYNYLSKESKKRHSYEDFSDCLKDGHTIFSTRHFWDCGRKSNRIMLGIALYQDPASWGFELIKERKWYIVWEQGAPFFPYPDNFSCGISKE